METQYIKELKASPLYNLSLSSKELFHSNFMYWLGQNQRSVFERVMLALANVDLRGKDWEVEREFGLKDDKNKKEINVRDYKSVDVCVLLKDKNRDRTKDKIIIALENKVKAIPDEKQLEAYRQKIESQNMHTDETAYVLLSLYRVFPGKTNINGWLNRTYADYATALKDLHDVNDTYSKLIIEDYRNFISNMDVAITTWLNQMTAFYSKGGTNAIVQEAEQIGFDDVVEKLRVSKALILLKEKLDCMPLISIKEMALNNVPNGVYASIGLSHATGIFDVKIVCNEDYIIGVQVQGNSYRHVVEFLKNDQKSLKQAWERLRMDSKLKSLHWLRFDYNIADEDFGNNSIFEKDGLELNPKHSSVDNDPAYHFNKYEDHNESRHFLYQNKSLKNGVSYEDVVDNVVAEIGKVKSVFPF